jgi:PKD repeat protein
MKELRLLLSVTLLALSPAVFPQNAPITTAATLLAPGPAVSVPVTVSGFQDIGSVALTLDYDEAVATMSGFTANALLPGFVADYTTIPGRIVMSWIGLSGVNLPDNSVLVELHFTGLVAGSTWLTWFDDGVSCEFSKFDNGEYTLLNDQPSSVYLLNGSLTHHRDAPVTIAPVYTAVPNTTVCIPVKVVGFTSIGSASLTLEYDPLVLTFQSYNSSTIPAGWAWEASADNPGTMVMGGFGPAFSLPDTSILFYACFQYHGGTSALEWTDDGTSCEYADQVFEPLYDLPRPVFYIDGLITETVRADFTADNLFPPKNTTVTFTDQSQFGPVTSWYWSFAPNTVVFVNGTSATDQNPQVQFTGGGLYTVTLTVTNAYSTDSETKAAYIRAGIHGLWIGATSEEWTVSTNWDDHLLPGNLSDVLITTATSPLFWPKFSGNLTLGSTPGNQCKSITFSGIGFKLTVSGTLTNTAGTSMDVLSGSYGNLFFQ